MLTALKLQFAPSESGTPAGSKEQASSELMLVVSELTAALAALPDIQQAFDRISALVKQVDTANTSGDLKLLKVRLNQCLTITRHEVLQQRQQMSDLISGTIARMRAIQNGTASPTPPDKSLFVADPLTGLPGRAYAEAELARTYGQFPDCNAGLFVVRRLNLIQTKFGFSRGDQVLLNIVQQVAQALPDFNNLFRWTPASFLAITSPSIPYQDVRKKAQILELHKITQTLEWEGHTALVPVSLRCRAFAIKEYESSDSLVCALDTFASEP
jgi:GGDEF domain-containing protein